MKFFKRKVEYWSWEDFHDLMSARSINDFQQRARRTYLTPKQEVLKMEKNEAIALYKFIADPNHDKADILNYIEDEVGGFDENEIKF